jgi:hypothetical protein
MDRRQFLVRALATGAAAVGASTLRGTPALAAAGSGSMGARTSAERFLLRSGRRALA